MDRIMLVEDEAIIALDVKKHLERLGYDVVAVAATGEEALSYAHKTNPNLILMDIKIRGEMDGIETAAKIHELLDIPVIYLTAFANDTTLARAQLTGAYGYLLKPFEDTELRAAIEIALYKHGTEKKLRESEERNAVVAQITNDAIWDWSLNKGEIFYSPRWKALLGLPEALNMVLPKEWLDRVHPDDFEGFNQAIAEHLRGKTPLLECEFRMMHSDGHPRWMLCKGMALFDAQNEAYRMIGIVSDITVQKRTAEKEKQRLKEAELLQQATFAIASSSNQQEVLDHILTGLQQLIPFESAVISLIEGEYVKIAALIGNVRHTKMIGELIKRSDGLLSLFENSLAPIILTDAQTHPKYEHWSSDGKDTIHAWMGIPLIAYERPIGFLMFNSQERDVFSEDHARLAQAFANQAAISIEKAMLFDQIRSGRERLQALSKKLVETQEDERRMLAHELHDEIGQELTGLQFILLMGKEGSEEEQVRSFDEAQALVAQMMSQVRELSLNLHPAMLDDLGLFPTLKAHFERFNKQTGIQVHFSHIGQERRFAEEVELTAFRVVQEALTNVARYAAVKDVEIAVGITSSSLDVTIEDRGKGFVLEDILSDSKRSFGLSGIRERTYLVGGKLEIYSKPNEGTRIFAYFPIGDKLERRKNDRPGYPGR